jgi:uncharacterized protein (TIGR02246 family)
MDAAWAQDWVEDYATAWREADADTVAQLFTEDAVYRSSPLRPPTVGRKAIRAYWQEACSSQENMQLSFGRPIVEGNRVAVEWWATMLDAGTPFTLPGALILRFSPGGRCQELREYWHSDNSRVDPPEGWGA